MFVLYAGSWFGESAVFDRGPRSNDARAAGEVHVLHFCQDDLESLLAVRPELWRHFGCLLSEKMRISLKMVENFVTLPVKTRLASKLVELANDYGRLRSDVPARQAVKVSQNELALMVGCTRQTINAMLIEMQERGVLALGRNVVDITDPMALVQQASGRA
ncbi:MAG: Crp/Fnr family transcriptional regulator [Polaromonas sp.]|nr:Crp/Fnr family transcriptional regulator [Polaromonas sp.]